MRVGDDRLLDVGIDAGAAAAMRADQLELDARAVLLVPLDLARLRAPSAGSCAVSIRTWIWCAGLPLPVREVITIGLPVVSCA